MNYKHKWHFLFDRFTSWYLLFGLLGGTVLYFLLIIFFLCRFYAHGERYEAILFSLLLFILWIVVFVALSRVQMFPRLLTRCYFDENGIQCYNCLWGHFSLKWEDVHTYGAFYSAASYVSYNMLFFSKSASEGDDRKQRYTLSKERLVFIYRPDLFNDMVEYIPQDMKRYLEESIKKRRDCYMRR